MERFYDAVLDSAAVYRLVSHKPHSALLLYSVLQNDYLVVGLAQSLLSASAYVLDCRLVCYLRRRVVLSEICCSVFQIDHVVRIRLHDDAHHVVLVDRFQRHVFPVRFAEPLLALSVDLYHIGIESGAHAEFTCKCVEVVLQADRYALVVNAQIEHAAAIVHHGADAAEDVVRLQLHLGVCWRFEERSLELLHIVFLAEDALQLVREFERRVAVGHNRQLVEYLFLYASERLVLKDAAQAVVRLHERGRLAQRLVFALDVAVESVACGVVSLGKARENLQDVGTVCHGLLVLQVLGRVDHGDGVPLVAVSLGEEYERLDILGYVVAVFLVLLALYQCAQYAYHAEYAVAQHRVCLMTLQYVQRVEVFLYELRLNRLLLLLLLGYRYMRERVDEASEHSRAHVVSRDVCFLNVIIGDGTIETAFEFAVSIDFLNLDAGIATVGVKILVLLFSEIDIYHEALVGPELTQLQYFFAAHRLVVMSVEAVTGLCVLVYIFNKQVGKAERAVRRVDIYVEAVAHIQHLRPHLGAVYL